MAAALSIDTTKLLGPLEREAVEALWPLAISMLLPALEREGWKVRPEQLRAQIATGEVGLYAAHDFATGEVFAVCACEVCQYPNAQVFSVSYCGGHDLAHWAHLIADIEREAVRLGCHAVRIPGRKGWGHIFPEYREVMRVYEREVIV